MIMCIIVTITYTISILNIYLHCPLHEYQHHKITILSQYQHDHSQLTNVKEFDDTVVIIPNIRKYLVSPPFTYM